MSEVLDISELNKIRSDIRQEIDQRSKDVNGLPASEAATRSPSFRLDSGISKRESSPPVLTFTVQTKTGAAVEIAQNYAEEYPAQVEIFRRERDTLGEPTSEVTPKSAQKLKSKRRPLSIGQSVSHMTGQDGTLGCFIEYDGQPALISASHVIAKSGRIKLPVDPTENYIVQPGGGASQVDAKDVVAALSEGNFSIIRADGVNDSDLAIADLIEGIEVSNEFPKGFGLPFEGQAISGISDLDNVVDGDRVFKIGIGSGVTWGTLREIDVSIKKISVPKVGLVDFDNFLRVEWDDGAVFAAPGDSGAVYVLEKDLTALAVHVTSFKYKSKQTFDLKEKKPVFYDFVDGKFSSFGCALEPLAKKYKFEIL